MTIEVAGFSVRRAVVADAAALAAVHVASWRATYAGILPQDLLDGLSVDERADRWAEILGGDHSTHVATDAAGTVVGFLGTGPSRDDDTGPEVGEVYAIYLDPQAWGKGVGRLLHDTVLAGMTSYAVATLWVAEGNLRGRAFYERQGWRPDAATKREELGGVEVVAVRYRRSLP